MSPRVTIGMPVLQAEETVDASIRSILAQTFSDWELIVVDDGSKDRTVAQCRAFGDSRIRIVADGTHRGLPSRLNQTVAAARGTYYARMDGDDIAFPDRIEKQIRFLELNPDIDLVGTGMLVFADSGKPQGAVPMETGHPRICRKPWSGFFLPHPTWFGRTRWFRENPYNQSARRAQDQDLLFRTYNTSRFACLPEILHGYRENRRRHRKVLQTRLTLVRLFLNEAMKRGDLGLAVLILSTFFFKAAADFLYFGGGWEKARNQFIQLDPEVQRRWEKIFREVHSATYLPKPR